VGVKKLLKQLYKIKVGTMRMRKGTGIGIGMGMGMGELEKIFQPFFV
jgi:hypothetical protein